MPRFDAEHLWRLPRIGAIALAPDGQRAVCSVTEYDLKAGRGRSALWLLDTARTAPRRLTWCGDKDGQPAWSPQGDRIAFVARREQQGAKDDTPQLYVISADGGEAERASRFAPGVEAFRWLPDGRGIVFAAWVWPDAKGAAAQATRWKADHDRKDTGYATSEAYYRFWDHNVPAGRALHLLRLDLASGRVTDLFEGTGLELPRDGGAAFDVHPDGRRIAFAHDPAKVQVLANRQRISEMDLATRRVKALADDAAWDFGAPCYASDGRLAMVAVNIGRSHVAHAQPALLEGRRWRVLAPGWDFGAEAPLRWADDGRTLLFTAEQQGRRHLFQLDTAPGAMPQLLREGGTVQAFDQAGGTLLWLEDRAAHPPRVFASRDGGAPRRLERFADGRLPAFGELREVTLKGANGDPVQMWLTFPPGFDARRRHPVLHLVHGGPYNAVGDGWSWRWNVQVFAAAGYVVAQVNFHGSTGFGFGFKSSLVGRQGPQETADIEAGTDWLRAQRWADPKRVIAAGGSYGGFLVAWMNGHVAPGRYAAYICHAGVFDRVSTFSADSYPERPKDLAANYWEDLPRVLAQSPHAFAGQMQTPTLVIHGAQDFRVPDCNGLAYYNTLKARGVAARLLWFPDENHWVVKPANALQWYREFLAWCDRYAGSARRSSEKPSSVDRSATTPSIGTAPV